ncbi:TIGR04086 family membrane protein [Dorea sp. YH-dor226]|uniref:TIGR04086 family membrane protein n=1 Tax=Dorea sp. YH-dor226 TaxID=3151119 RepID=UPI003242F880
MNRRMQKDSKVMWVLKSLLVAYVITGILLLVLAMALYKLELNEGIVRAAITAIYVVSTLIGGIVIGKLARTRRFIWGLGIGIGYFALLLLITLGVYHTLKGNGTGMVTTLILCAGGGMIGGMIS